MKEYGGYLPLELRQGKEYYDFDSSHIIKINSGITSLYCALKIINPQKVFVPYFICPTVDNLIFQMNVSAERYYIDDKFQPIDVKCSEDDCVIIVNYFGINTEMIKKFIPKYGKVIIDNTQAFFAEPIFAENVYNIYSCRKFIGVADGGYLIGENLSDIELQKDMSSERSSFLMKQYEVGINGAYTDSLNNYNQIKSKRLLMSDFTKRVLRSVDYDFIIKRRKTNFAFLHKRLQETNQLLFRLSNDVVPYSYPYMINEDIRSKLIENKIYIPWIWKEKVDSFCKTNHEYYFNNIYHLPIDQRYDQEDMVNISKVVLSLKEIQHE